MDHDGSVVRNAAYAQADKAQHDAQHDASSQRTDTHSWQLQTEHAAQALGREEHQKLLNVGLALGKEADRFGATAEKWSHDAPERGRVLGAAAGLGTSVALEARWENLPRLVGAGIAGEHLASSFHESLDRHGMTTVLPSLEHRIENVEQQARQSLQASRAQHQATPAQAPAPAPTLADPRHPGHAMYNQAREGVHKIDAQMGRQPDHHSDQLAGALTAAAKAQGMGRIDQVALSHDGAQAFALQQVIPNALTRDAQVQTSQAVHQPLAQSTAAWEQSHMLQSAQAQNQTQAQAQQQGAPVMGR